MSQEAKPFEVPSDLGFHTVILFVIFVLIVLNAETIYNSAFPSKRRSFETLDKIYPHIQMNMRYHRMFHSFPCRNKGWVCFETRTNCTEPPIQKKESVEAQKCREILSWNARELGEGRYCYRSIGTRGKAKAWIAYTKTKGCSYSSQSTIAVQKRVIGEIGYDHKLRSIPTKELQRMGALK